MARRRGGGRPDSGVSGCVVIDKPAGCTSHDVVDDVRRALGTRKVGHAGTLDPDATGVLVLGVGLGTKLLQFVTGSDKSYAGQFRLRVETSTLDASRRGHGQPRHVGHPGPGGRCCERASSAISNRSRRWSRPFEVDGKRLHELAREGKEVEREPRPVTVHRYETAPTDDPLLYELDVECSSGTYIRTLVADVGHALGGGAHLALLRRTAVGPFGLDDCCTIDDITLRPLLELVRGMAIIDVDDVIAGQVRNGRSLGPAPGAGRLAVRGPSEELLAIYEARDGEFRPLKVLVGN